jgi:hypothetical protein
MDHVWVPKRDPAFKKLQEDSKKKIQRIEQSNCAPHDMVFNSGRFKAHYKCRLCGGVMDTVAYKWYTLGLEHGRAAQRGTTNG